MKNRRVIFEVWGYGLWPPVDLPLPVCIQLQETSHALLDWNQPCLRVRDCPRSDSMNMVNFKKLMGFKILASWFQIKQNT